MYEELQPTTHWLKRQEISFKNVRTQKRVHCTCIAYVGCFSAVSVDVVVVLVFAVHFHIEHMSDKNATKLSDGRAKWILWILYVETLAKTHTLAFKHTHTHTLIADLLFIRSFLPHFLSLSKIVSHDKYSTYYIHIFGIILYKYILKQRHYRNIIYKMYKRVVNAWICIVWMLVKQEFHRNE